MIADEIKKAGQATIDQSTDLLTYRLTDTWTTYSGEHNVLAALACDTGGSYWYDGDYGEWNVTFTQDVCRYNGTPVKTYLYRDHSDGEYTSYEVYDFNDNQLYYSEDTEPTSFTVRQIEFQNNKQSFQLLSSGQPTYTDDYFGNTNYSEAGLFNTSAVPSKRLCFSIYRRYLVGVSYGEKRTLKTINSGSGCVMLMINAVQSDNYDWSSASLPSAWGRVYAHITTYSGTNILYRDVRFNYYNPGNMMVILQPYQKAEVYVSVGVNQGQTTNVLCTIQEISL